MCFVGQRSGLGGLAHAHAHAHEELLTARETAGNGSPVTPQFSSFAKTDPRHEETEVTAHNASVN